MSRFDGAVVGESLMCSGFSYSSRTRLRSLQYCAHSGRVALMWRTSLNSSASNSCGWTCGIKRSRRQFGRQHFANEDFLGLTFAENDEIHHYAGLPPSTFISHSSPSE